MDLELARLQNELMRIQEQDEPTNIPERTCIDIILKLLEKKKISLFISNCGEYFFTPEQLENEIRDYLFQQDGRMNIIECANSIGISVEVVENKVQEIVKKKDKKLKSIIIEGECISDMYFNNIANEINDLLQECGQLGISELAERFHLPASLIKEEITKRIGTNIYGVLRNQWLCTNEFSYRIYACVRGAFIGASTPVHTDNIATAFNLDMDSISTVCQKLMDEGLLNGKMQGRTFVPNCFLDSQKNHIDSFYLSNNYILYKTLKEMNISKPKEFLEKKFKDKGLALNSMYIHPNLLSCLIQHVQQAKLCESWVDISLLLPSCINEEDMEIIMQYIFSEECDKNNEDIIRLSENTGVILSSKYFNKIVENILVFVEKKIDEIFYICAPVSSAAVSNANIFLQQKKIGNISNEDNNQNESKHINSHKTKGKKEKKTKFSAEQDTKEKKNEKKEKRKEGYTEAESVINEILNNKEMIKKSTDELLNEIGEHSQQALNELLFKTLLPLCKKRLDEVKQKEFLSEQLEKNQRNEKFIKTLTEKFDLFQLTLKSLQALNTKLGSGASGLDKDISIFIAYFFRVPLFEILDPLIKFAFFDLDGNEVFINSQNRKSTIELLKKTGKYQGIINVFNSAINKNPENIIEDFISASSDVHLVLHRLDKKKEKKMLLHKKNEYENQIKLASLSDPQSTFFFVINYLTIQALNVHVEIPNELWALNLFFQILMRLNNANLFNEKLGDFNKLLNAANEEKQNHASMQTKKELEIECNKVLQSFQFPSDTS